MATSYTTTKLSHERGYAAGRGFLKKPAAAPLYKKKVPCPGLCSDRYA